MDHNLPETVNVTETPTEAAQPEALTSPSSFETTKEEYGQQPSGDRSNQGDAATAHKGSRIRKRRKDRLEVGEHVSFIAEGIKGSGTVDAVMPDNSVVWVWADGGLGRRMLHQGTGTFIQPSRPTAELA